MTHVYATTDILAELVGSPDRQGYVVAELLPDPVVLDDCESCNMALEVLKHVLGAADMYRLDGGVCL